MQSLKNVTIQKEGIDRDHNPTTTHLQTTDQESRPAKAKPKQDHSAES